MSHIRVHYQESLDRAKKNYPELYQEKEKVIRWLLLRLHVWLDWYAGRVGEDGEGAYDFSGVYNKIRHRAKRHHMEGISEGTRKFTSRYGREFEQLIWDEIKRHVGDDFKCVLKGDVPFKTDYPAIFWKTFRQ